jgi:hypothetical protein
MDLFNEMVDAILMCKKPTICRVNGMRVAGGQEIGMACDLAITSDLAIFGQAGARTARPRTAAPPTSCPGCSTWKTPCGTASPARCGRPTR